MEQQATPVIHLFSSKVAITTGMIRLRARLSRPVYLFSVIHDHEFLAADMFEIDGEGVDGRKAVWLVGHTATRTVPQPSAAFRELREAIMYGIETKTLILTTYNHGFEQAGLNDATKKAFCSVRGDAIALVKQGKLPIYNDLAPILF